MALSPSSFYWPCCIATEISVRSEFAFHILTVLYTVRCTVYSAVIPTGCDLDLLGGQSYYQYWTARNCSSLLCNTPHCNSPDKTVMPCSSFLCNVLFASQCSVAEFAILDSNIPKHLILQVTVQNQFTLDKHINKKSCIREPKNVSTDADSSTDTKEILLVWQNQPKNYFFHAAIFHSF